MIRALAIDDEPMALEVIRSHSGKVPFLQLEGCFTDGLEAVGVLADNPVDLVFLDIKMPDISGLELLESLNTRPLVIFTTAYPEHAVKSYELDAVDYLLKPFSFSRFLKACNKANDLLLQLRPDVPGAGSIFIKSGYEQVRVHFSEILYLEGAGNYMSFILADGRNILSRLTMSEALALLPATQFVRIHRSYVVNRERVHKIERHQVHVGRFAVPVGGAWSAGLAG